MELVEEGNSSNGEGFIFDLMVADVPSMKVGSDVGGEEAGVLGSCWLLWALLRGNNLGLGLVGQFTLESPLRLLWRGPVWVM